MSSTADTLHQTNRLLRDTLLRLGLHGEIPHLPGLTLTRHDCRLDTENSYYPPAISVVVQGGKETAMGLKIWRYGENDCLVNGVDMACRSRVLEASRETPFLGLSLRIDRQLAAALMAEHPGTSASGVYGSGLSVARTDPDVLDAFLRLVELAEIPDQAPMLAPLIIREIHLRILMGPQGSCLRMAGTPGSHWSQVADAISWLRENFRQQLDMDDLARRVRLARTTFHRHFKQITSLSPLQFQKRLRLHEAQRLMLAENMDAAGAARAVGYQSASQFNREYKRLFGEPPHRDIARLRRS